MEQKEIIEGNILIERFVGINTYYMPEIQQLMVNVRAQDHIYLSNWAESKFHLSWDWLMPVVGRIHALGHLISINAYPTDNTTECVLYLNMVGAQEIRNEEPFALTAIWKSVVEFLKSDESPLHNSQTPNK